MNDNDYNGKVYAYISIGLTAAAAVAFGLTFTVLKIYALIAAVLLGLTALSFANLQKRKNNFPQLIFIRVAAYIVLGVSVLFFIGGIVWSLA